MNPPSAKAQCLAEEILDHVDHGLTRAARIQELAAMIDEAWNELVAAATTLVNEAEGDHSPPDPHTLARLNRALAGYRGDRPEFESCRSGSLLPALYRLVQRRPSCG